MHDDGKSADAVTGHCIYTLQILLKEPAGHVQLQVSAAFRGLLRRVTSSIVTLDVWNVLVNQTLPLTLAYPSAWTVDSRPGFTLLTDNTNISDYFLEEPPDILIYTDPNSQQLTPNAYYDGISYPAYYQDSQSVQSISACGISGFMFLGVLGENPSEVVILPTPTGFIRFVNSGDQDTFLRVLGTCSVH